MGCQGAGGAKIKVDALVLGLAYLAKRDGGKVRKVPPGF